MAGWIGFTGGKRQTWIRGLVGRQVGVPTEQLLEELNSRPRKGSSVAGAESSASRARFSNPSSTSGSPGEPLTSQYADNY